MKRVEKIVNSKAKKTDWLGRDLDGGFSPQRGRDELAQDERASGFAKQGHEVVMSPTDFAYLDYGAGRSRTGTAGNATLRLKKPTNLSRCRKAMNPQLIKGGQANLWTEQIYNMRHLLST